MITYLVSLEEQRMLYENVKKLFDQFLANLSEKATRKVGSLINLIKFEI